MNTVAHMVIASAVMARPDRPKQNWAMLAGSFLPDASMFVFFAWSRLQGWSGEETWNVRYWTEPWQMLGAISNSFVLFGLFLAIAWWRKWPLLMALSAAALIHIGLDLPLHADDAHRHFWPISDWRFVSPISYWDPDHMGWLGGLIESLATLVAITVLWRRFPGKQWRIALFVLGLVHGLFLAAQIAWWF